MGIHDPEVKGKGPNNAEAGKEEEQGQLIENEQVPMSYTKAGGDAEEGLLYEHQHFGKHDNWQFDSLLRWVAVIAAALFICGILMFVRHNTGLMETLPQELCSYDTSAVCPATELFVDPELHEAATETLMHVGSGFFSSADRDRVKAIVAQSFKNISVELDKDAPIAAAMLNAVQLSQAQREALVGLMRLVREPQLQRLGFEVAQAIRDVAVSSPDLGASERRERVSEHLQRMVSQRQWEMWHLSNELVPVALREFWGEGDVFRMTLRPDNLQVMETVHDDWNTAIGSHREDFQAQLQVTAQALSPSEALQRSYGLFGGVLEEGRVLLDMIELHVHSLGHRLSMPQLAVSIRGDESVGAEPLSCDFDQGKTAQWFMKAILCPLKFGTQGVDALRAAGIHKNTGPGKRQRQGADASRDDEIVDDALKEADSLHDHMTLERTKDSAAPLDQQVQALDDETEQALREADALHAVVSRESSGAARAAASTASVGEQVQVLDDATEQALREADALHAAMASGTSGEARGPEEAAASGPLNDAVAKALKEADALHTALSSGQHAAGLNNPSLRARVEKVVKAADAHRAHTVLQELMAEATLEADLERAIHDADALRTALALKQRGGARSSDGPQSVAALKAATEKALRDADALHAALSIRKLDRSALASQLQSAEEDPALKASIEKAMRGADAHSARMVLQELMAEATAESERVKKLQEADAHLELRSRCQYARGKQCTALDMLDQPDIRAVAMNEVLRAASRSVNGIFSDAHHSLVHAAVEEGFRNISRSIKEHSPGLATELSHIWISRSEKDLIASLMGLTQEPRLQRLGLDIAWVISQSAPAARFLEGDTRKKFFEHQIKKALFPKRGPILALAEELLTEPMRKFLGSEGVWGMTLGHANVVVMQLISDEWADLIGEDPDRAENRLKLTERALETPGVHFDIFNGVVQEGRFVLDVLKLHSRSLGFVLDMPSLTFMPDDYEKYGVETQACHLHGEAHHWLLKAVVCPLKLGSQGLAALRAALDIMHFDPTAADPVFAKAEEMAKFGVRALDLLNHPDIHGVAREEVLAAASRNVDGIFSDSQHMLVHATVDEAFRNITNNIRTFRPGLASELRGIVFSRSEKDLVVSLMRLTQEPRLQRLGFDVAQAISQSARTASFLVGDTRKKYFEHQIMKALSPQRRDILSLSEELLTEPMHKFLGARGFWGMTLDPANVEVMQTISDGWADLLGEHPDHAKKRLQLTARALETPEAHFDILNSVVQDGRFVLDVIKLHARLSLGFDLNMPSLHFLSDNHEKYGVESMACDLHGKAHHWLLKAVVCPLKLGSQGLAALRAALDLMNFDPTEVDPAFTEAEEKAGPTRHEYCVYSKGHRCSAMHLFMNPGVQRAAADVVTKAASAVFGGIFSDAGHGLVYGAVAEGFQNISMGIRRDLPSVAGVLHRIQISQADRDRLIGLMKLTYDPRLQSIGLDVAQAIRRSARTADFVRKGMKRVYLMHEIQEALFPRRKEIMELSEEFLDRPTREFLGDEDYWSATLDPANIQLMETVGEEWGALVGEHPRVAEAQLRAMEPTSTAESRMDLFHGAVLEGNFILDMISLHAHSLGLPLETPSPMLLVPGSGGDRGAARVSCDLSEGGRPGHQFLKAIICPLRFGAQGLDALRAVYEITRFKPDRVNLAFAAAEQQAIFNIDEQSSMGAQSCTYAEMPECPAQEILLNPEFHTVAAETLMQVSHGLLGTDDRPMVQHITTQGFHNISRELKNVAPDVMATLGALQLTLDDKEVILQLMRLMDEPRVQLIGLEVGKAIRESVPIHDSVIMFDMEYDFKRHIEHILSPHHDEILRLREELLPQSLIEFLGIGRFWSLTLHPDNIRVMEGVDDRWDQLIKGEHGHFQAQTPADGVQRSLGVFAGVLEEGRVLLDMLELHARSLGRNVSMPQLAVAVNSQGGADSRSVSCDLEDRDPAFWFLKAVLCRLKFGAQGLDALRAIPAMPQVA